MRLKIEGHETADDSHEFLTGSLWISEKSGRVYILLYNYKHDDWCAYAMATLMYNYKHDDWCTYAMATLKGLQRVSWRGDHEDPAEAVKGLIPAPPLTIRWE